MSILQTANIYLDSAMKYAISCDSNNVVFSISNVEVISSQVIDRISKFSPDNDPPTGTYKLSYNSSNGAGYIPVTNAVLSRALYPELSSSINSNYYRISMSGVANSFTSFSLGTFLYGLAYGNGVFVGVGSDGVFCSIQTSTDGTSWTTRTIANSYTLNGVAYGNGVFVGVGVSGATQRSTDGITWTYNASANANQLNSVTYGNGVFVAAGNSGTVQVSRNGTKWTNIISANVNTINGVTYGNGIYVAVGAAGSIQTSTDALTWTDRVTANVSAMNTVAYGNGTYVAMGATGALQTSHNAINWFNATSPTASNIEGLTYANGLFVAAGALGAIYSSTNGITWSNNSVGSSNSYAVAYGNGRFVTVTNTLAAYATDDPATMVGYNTSTHFALPSYAEKFSPYINEVGHTVYIYVKT